jgi:hypothetical protein
LGFGWPVISSKCRAAARVSLGLIGGWGHLGSLYSHPHPSQFAIYIVLASFDTAFGLSLGPPWAGLGHLTPRDPGPQPSPKWQMAPKEITTAPVTAIGFASINGEIRTELEKRVLWVSALQGEPFRAHGPGIRATGCSATDRPPPARPSSDMQESSWSTTDQPRTKSPGECDAPRRSRAAL